MYQQFKNQFLLSLSSFFSSEDLSKISQKLDVVAYNYDFQKKETSLTVYKSEIPELVKTFLVCKKIEGISQATLYNYGIILKHFFEDIQTMPENVSPNDIRVYLYNYQEQRHITNRSLDKIRQTLSSFFKWAHNEGYLERDPMLTIKKN